LRLLDVLGITIGAIDGLVYVASRFIVIRGFGTKVRIRPVLDCDGWVPA
jgi:hypothetical protein